ncbi:hypothetical protein J7E99_34840 [Streptomyces sp. ISL-44]|uniref:hypothetical protein n=1 Tax=Streptomyces sp. ISL-44 TaxID=2819184 RepID=UPI001BE8AAFE|nr:hypothetical protein [Streptomyces sp. ISL-44]MBT2545722.1 hypothetical protein [Streptomyces sp. ISL-44]
MTNRYADEQLAIVAKMVRRTVTRRERARFDKNFDRWMREEWNGSEMRSFVACLAAVSTACGGARGEWGTLTEGEQQAMVHYFGMAYLPTRDEAYADAEEFVEFEVRRATVGMKEFAQYLVRMFADPRG